MLKTISDISKDTVITRAPSLLSTDVDGETILLNIDRGHYYSLDAAVGTRIWELIESPVTIAVLFERLLGEFEVDAERCGQEIKLFIAELVNEGLVTITRQ